MSHEPEFVDHYEVLQLAQNADADMIERVYRLLAKRYHPDNAESGDEQRFLQVRDAFDVLSDPERRAAFDVRYDEQSKRRWRIFEQGSVVNQHAQDQRIFRALLMLLYAARRDDPKAGGLGAIHIEDMLGIPREHLDFPIWYLRKRGFLETLQSGELAITIEGIDWLNEKPDSSERARMLEAGDGSSQDYAATA